MLAKSWAQQKAAGDVLVAKRSYIKKSELKGASRSRVGPRSEEELYDLAPPSAKRGPRMSIANEERRQGGAFTDRRR